jgi:alpha-L-rhamnosidase
MKRISLFILLIISATTVFAKIQPVNLKCEYRINPKGIDIPEPRFFWQMVSAEKNQFQTAYHLLVATSKEKLKENRGDAFDSGKVKSDQNTHVVYQGKKLEPATDYFWKVNVWDKNKEASGWSDAAKFSTGLFENSDWKGARWIAWKPQDTWEKEWWKRKEVELKCTETYLPSYFGARMSLWERYHFHHENPYDPAPLMRKEFETNKEIEGAKVFISGIGYYELFINGRRVGDHVLDPGWTNYKKTVLYVEHDVTPHFQKGANAIGVMLGRGNYGLLAVDHWGFYKKDGWIGQPKLKCRFKIRYADGSVENIVSDLSWKVTGGPVLYDGPHMGELYDATQEIDGWNRPGLDDSDWDDVNPAPAPGGELKAQLCEPIRVVKKFQPVKVEKRGWVHWADAGTNLSGWIWLKVNAPKGTRIGIYYGENEDPRDHGQPGGYQQMAYIAKGEKDEIAECRFSYKGFRYVNIVGYPGKLTPEDIEICQVNSDVRNVGDFVSSDTMLNAIHRICKKSMIFNLHSIPTDCPHREKNGWMGDAITGMEYGMANYDLAALMTKFTRDMFDTQDENGRMSTIAPDNNYTKGLSPLWSSACIHVPWYMYTFYGDTRLFEIYWNKMKRFTRGVWKYNGVEGKPGIFTDVLADWCSPHGNISDEGPEVYTTMNFFLVLKRLGKMAKILDKKDDAADFEEQAEKVQEAIYKYCFDEKNLQFGGVTPSGYRQGPNAMALQYGIVKPQHQKPVLEGLVQDITQNRENHFYGGIFTGHALWELMPHSGHSKLALDVAKTDTYPGYGYMLKNGATTVWEHWEDKASHIHHFMGFVDNFLYWYVAGINMNEANPGFKEIVFSPTLPGLLKKARARYQSLHGDVAIEWNTLKDEQVEVHLSIPVNCSGKFFLPPGIADVMNQSGEKLGTKENARGSYLELPSGEHRFVCYLVNP